MKKSTKGTLAASAAAVLLLGGFGTHAAWSDGKAVGGTDIKTGHLALINANCGAWKIGTGTLTTFDPTTLLVPGDLLTRVCTFEVDVAGAVNAKLSVSAPTILDGSGNVVSAVTPTATFKDVTGGGSTAISTGDGLSDGEIIQATVTVNVPSSAPQDLAGHLNDITVTATQS